MSILDADVARSRYLDNEDKGFPNLIDDLVDKAINDLIAGRKKAIIVQSSLVNDAVYSSSLALLLPSEEVLRKLRDRFLAEGYFVTEIFSSASGMHRFRLALFPENLEEPEPDRRPRMPSSTLKAV